MEGVRAIGLEDGVRAALLLAGVGAVLSAVGFLQRASTGSAAPKFTRAAKVSVTKLVLVQVVLVGGLYSYFMDGGWTLESVGVSSGLSPAIAFVVGLGEFVLFSTAVRLFFYMRGSPLSYWQAILRTNTRFIHTKRSQRIAMIGVGLLNPATEELIFRGLLVHQLAITGAPMWFALALATSLRVVVASFVIEGARRSVKRLEPPRGSFLLGSA
jgi:membrane protease YdiL (CAAX protease family)